MQNLLRTQQVDIPDIETLDEMVTYIRKENGSMGASKGNFDDRVISLVGANYVLKLNPLLKVIKKQESPRPAKKFSQFRKGKSATKINRKWR